ncbi:holo-ACP synthase [Neobacillus bataviensis]|uniref:citrate lyase holo-[acyl-carrier protein] synthase n=1 Tax=Neobacillus bataviensis TaxID=220685 RepID=A0A561CEI2_9BACI|nr:citrate lyase holo-[acyl-carrier protein] synthase [Neobacillus bataviensis]TWD89639.1 holo-ACP synthase [Neobacillus bataviensis]
MTVTQQITLGQLLEARELRAAHQKKLIGIYGLPLVSFTVNMPGASKKTLESSIIFREGCNALVKKLRETDCGVEYYDSKDPDTGFEALFVVKTKERSLKALMIEIENEHPLGRLFDFDVIGVDGKPFSRETIGNSKRKCLLCEQDAHICGRNRGHTTEALIEKIHSMVNSYIKIIS